MDETVSPKKFEQWLIQAENNRLLKIVSHRLYEKMSLKCLSLPGLTLKISDAEEIYQELMAFILQKPNIQKALLRDAKGIVTYINSAFLNHVIEKARAREESQDIYDNAWRYFYRRFSVVLNESSEWKKYKSASKGLCFGMSDKEPRSIILSEDLMKINFPDNISMNHEAIKKKKTILRLAAHFWKENARLTGEPHIRISVADFVSWINGSIKLSTTIESFPTTNNNEEDKYQFNPLINQAADPVPDSRKLVYIHKWAINFFNSLQGEEKNIFYYYECQGLKSRKISELMGRKANLSYQRDKIRSKLKAFLRPLEWLSPEPAWKNEKPDLEAFRVFTEKLCEKLGQKMVLNII
ncbi:hypothetical protein [Desulfobacula sp.]